jgi:hypothetical protein
VLLDAFEDLPGLDDAAVVFLVFPRHLGGEEVVVPLPHEFRNRLPHLLAEALVPEGEFEIQVLSENALGKGFDQRVVERLRLRHPLLGVLVGGDVPGDAEGADRSSPRVAKGHFCLQEPRDGPVARCHPLFGVDHRLPRADDLLFDIEGMLGAFGGEEVEIGLADEILRLSAEATGEGLVDAGEAALAVLEVDEIRERVQEDAEKILVARLRGPPPHGLVAHRGAPTLCKGNP